MGILKSTRGLIPLVTMKSKCVKRERDHSRKKEDSTASETTQVVYCRKEYCWQFGVHRCLGSSLLVLSLGVAEDLHV